MFKKKFGRYNSGTLYA